MNSFNLSTWVLQHRSFTGFILALLVMSGIYAFFHLEQREDPKFNFRMMVVTTYYPGANSHEVEQQVTDKLEEKLQELPNLDFLRSYSKPGESVIFIMPKQHISPKDIPENFYQVRKKIGDMRLSLPTNVIGPFFNDEFGDTYSFLYAFSAPGYSYKELKSTLDSVREQLLHIGDVEKVDLIGTQEEKIYLNFSDKKLANFALDITQVAEAIQAQNTLSPAGVVSGSERDLPIYLTGAFKTPEDLATLPLDIKGKALRLGDLAKVSRSYVDPPLYKTRFDGKEVMVLGISMNKYGNVKDLGKRLSAAMAKIQMELPAGIEVTSITDQQKVVDKATSDFLSSFIEALAAVLLVSFLSLGFRAGAVVALSVPLVIAGTFLCMLGFGMEIHRITLGSLVLSLGLLVDDAMIAVEMMARKLEEGLDKMQAASFAYTSTAFPMLTGTLITIAGFLPVGLAKSQAGEYTVGIFQIVAITLLLSWLGAVVITPYFGYALIKKSSHAHELFNTPFYRHFRHCVHLSVKHRFKVITATLVLLVLGVVTLTHVPEQFFPLSDRPELLVQLTLPEGSSIAKTESLAKKLESFLAKDTEIKHYAAYVGGGSPRFYLLMVQQLYKSNFAEFLLICNDVAARERIRKRLQELFAQDFPGVLGRVLRLETGPPTEYPVIFRVQGENADNVQRIAKQVEAVVRANPFTLHVHNNWNETMPSLRLVVNQDKARVLGVSTHSIAQALQAYYSGLTLGQFREGNQLIDIVWRAEKPLRRDAVQLPDIAIKTLSGKSIPLNQLVHIETVFEPGTIWRYNRLPTVSVVADIVDGHQGPEISNQILPKLSSIIQQLPSGYGIDVGAEKEEAQTAQQSILAWIPLMLVLMLILLMMQLQNVARTFLVLCTAPLGVIGAAFALKLFHAPFGFVALLGLIALAGMDMRNSVILIDQIQQEEKNRSDHWTAIVESTVKRFRPITLTASAAILAMIPLSQNDFFGPQAIVVMGGLSISTLLTLFFLPALYAAWFRVKP